MENQRIIDWRKAQLSDEEIILFMLIESGMDSRDLGGRLGMSHQYVLNKYMDAKSKLKRQKLI